MPTGIRKAPPTKLPPTMRMGEGSVKVQVPLLRKQPPLVKYAPGVLESSSSGSCETRMLIRKEDAASMVSLRVPSSLPAKGQSRGKAGQCDAHPARNQHNQRVWR